MTLPFEARNKVLFIIVGFADHPVSDFPRSQPFIFYRQKLCKGMQKNSYAKELVFCDLWFPDSGFRIPVSDSGFRIPLPHFGFRFLGFSVAPIGNEKHKHNISRLFGQKTVELLTGS